MGKSARFAFPQQGVGSTSSARSIGKDYNPHRLTVFFGGDPLGQMAGETKTEQNFVRDIITPVTKDNHPALLNI
ncbi:MAG: hypothetical protein ACM3TN_16635 [Alphaproteobacteria bacterium]